MIRRTLAVLLVATSLTGCLGHNALSRKVLRWNLTAAEGRWTREALFVGLWIIPVYLITYLVDFLVINSWEFWAGENPINGRKAVVDIPKAEFEKLGFDAIDVAWVERIDERHANLHVEFENGDKATFDVVRDADEYTISYAGVEFYRGRLRM